MWWMIFRAIVDAVLEFGLLRHRTRGSLLDEVGISHGLRISDATGSVYRVGVVRRTLNDAGVACRRSRTLSYLLVPGEYADNEGLSD